MYSNKVNGHAFSGEHLTSNIDYFTVTTDVNLTTAVSTGLSNLDKFVEIIATRGQPVIMGAVTGSGPYVLKFATEHKGSWNVTGSQSVDNSAADLKAAIDAVFDTATTSVVLSANL